MPGWVYLLIAAFHATGYGSEAWDLINDELFTLPGQIRLGGLFAIHTKANITYNESQLGPLTCHSFHLHGFVEALAMKFAIEEINNSSSLLPGVRLGYEIHDTCLESVVILRSVIRFLGEGNGTEIQVSCNYTDYRTRVAAVIGPSTTEMVTATGKLLGFFHIPQISFSASSERLSKKMVFPSFLRTVPSDRVQAQAMVQLLNSLQWHWIVVVGSSDLYGQEGLYQFSLKANQEGICIAHEDYLPEDGSADAFNKSMQIIEKIRKTRANVTVLFASHDQSQAFLAIALSANLQMVWIASTGWSLSSTIRLMPGVHRLGTVIGFAVKSQPIPGFYGYVTGILSLLAAQAQMASQNRSTGECNDGPYMKYEQQEFQTTCMECSKLTPANISMINDSMTQSLACNVYTAVYSVAHALHQMLHCSGGAHCQLDTYPHAWQLLNTLKNINFTINDRAFSFDENGNPNIGYDIVTWTASRSGALFNIIGSYTDQLNIHNDQIQWHTRNEKPNSTCSKVCMEGEIEVVKGAHSCCFDCISCPEGTFANTTDFSPVCSPCPDGQWSRPGSIACLPPSYTSFMWTHFFIITLLGVKVAVLLLVIVVALLYLIHRRTPLVHACGRSLSVLALAGLAAMCCSIILFVARPSDLICQLQQPFFAGALSACLASFLVQSLRIVACTSIPWQSGSCIHWLVTRGAGLLVLGLLLVQVFFCGMFVQASPVLSAKMAAMSVRSLNISLNCSIDRFIEFSFMFGYNALLVLFSFICSFLSAKPVRQYNLARDITFAMLIFLSAWIVFIPCYASSTGQDKALIQATVILFSCLGVLATAFMPKCYILLFKTELNTPEHFAAYLPHSPGQKDLDSEGPGTQ